MGMNVIFTLGEKRKEKQWKYQRSMLRTLSINDMKKDVQRRFFAHEMEETVSQLYLQDFCLDVGIDAFLLGAEFARFGYYGEPEFTVMRRCAGEINMQIDQTVAQFVAWLKLDDAQTAVYKEVATGFIYEWWRQGFDEGRKRHQLKLH
ncbi:DUF2521 family protein [Salipaludibacillus agaradhaerens]|jgi:hypothetical protein|uniref:DUF2521 family protein n=1 Tax=Salipaludibacillus agaradhaerens TaxID=76935 RepID=A0A9Q4G086_SALAG|nr:DUF2521 family protein [Salipaludibacillus agaradhaerens]MCR6098221.1 DUF2521 family protein [Salipaludibacillus agaradhaerens]MCR6116149.1 DUF2521 family protein [Salipaludibacillus agaradhaerens]